MLILTEKSETQTWICLFLTSWKSLHLRINDSTSTVSKKTPAALLASPIYSQGITLLGQDLHPDLGLIRFQSLGPEADLSLVQGSTG